MSSSKKLTKRQIQVLECIRQHVSTHGFPPSVREIGEYIGLSSPSTVQSHINALVKKGYVRRQASQSRTLEIIDEPMLGSQTKVQELSLHKNEILHRAQLDDAECLRIPIIGSVAAGNPITAYENIEDYLPCPTWIRSSKPLFALRIKGNSMIDVGIHNGDVVIVEKDCTARDRDIVVALIDDEATVKTFYREQEYIRLQPENPYMQPIFVKNPLILGKVIGLFRNLKNS